MQIKKTIHRRQQFHPISLVLLDLNLPGTDGFEVLRTLRSHDSLQQVPVIVLSTSKDEDDIQRCYDLGANSYMQKPVGFVGFVSAIARLKEYWFKVVILPRSTE